MNMHTALKRVSPDCLIIPCLVVTNSFRGLEGNYCHYYFCCFGHCACFVFIRETLLLRNEYFLDCNMMKDTSGCFNLFLYLKSRAKTGPQSISKIITLYCVFCHSSIYFLYYGAYVGSECNFLHEQTITGDYCKQNSPMSLHDC